MTEDGAFDAQLDAVGAFDGVIGDSRRAKLDLMQTHDGAKFGAYLGLA